MNIRRLIGTIGLIGVLAGCNLKPKYKVWCEGVESKETLESIPISVEIASSKNEQSLAIVIKLDNGYKTLCKFDKKSEYAKDLVKAVALVRSEINDGDNEKIELEGQYVNIPNITRQIFEITSLIANGYKIRLKYKSDYQQ